MNPEQQLGPFEPDPGLAAYHQGCDDGEKAERAAIVAYLRSDGEERGGWAWRIVRAWADAIEQGRHLEHGLQDSEGRPEGRPARGLEEHETSAQHVDSVGGRSDWCGDGMHVSCSGRQQDGVRRCRCSCHEERLPDTCPKSVELTGTQQPCWYDIDGACIRCEGRQGRLSDSWPPCMCPEVTAYNCPRHGKQSEDGLQAWECCDDNGCRCQRGSCYGPNWTSTDDCTGDCRTCGGAHQ